MDLLYFLALPLSDEEQHRLLTHKKWQLFLNKEPYLSLISLHEQVFLAKPLPAFPLSWENWEQFVCHVMTLLKQIFLCPDTSSLQLLVCSLEEMRMGLSRFE